MFDPGLVTESPNLIEEIYIRFIKTSLRRLRKLASTNGSQLQDENQLMTLLRPVSYTEKLPGEGTEKKL